MSCLKAVCPALPTIQVIKILSMIKLPGTKILWLVEMMAGKGLDYDFIDHLILIDKYKLNNLLCLLDFNDKCIINPLQRVVVFENI